MSLAPPIPLSTPGITINDNPLNAISDPSQIDKKDPLQANDSPRSSLDGEKGKYQHRALEPVMSGPKFNIRILLMSGQSHTFSFPPETNIGQLKNLVWGEWPDEWNADPSRPPAPNYFRLLYLGRMLLDPEVLAGLNLQPAPGSTIIHLSIRTFAPQPEEPVKRSILPFSLPTIPRPSGLSSRQNSTNVATTIPPGSGGTTGSPHVPSSARADVAAGDAQPVPVTTTATTTRRIESEGEHGGGCKCLIM